MADDNRSINICLINTNKKVESIPDNNRIGIDHINSFIWFDDKAQRDNYMALKTVDSQTRNSKIRDFNAPNSIRYEMKMKDYYALDIDLVKINHTVEGLENEYFYNITDVDYVNNETILISITMNEMYTYFMDNVSERTQMQGVLSKSNFKNQNIDINYINNIAKSLIGDNYGAGEFDSGVKKVVQPNDIPDEKTGISWFVMSARKKPNIVDDSINENLTDQVTHGSFSDEVIISMPFLNSSGKVVGIRGRDQKPVIKLNATIAYISYLFLNGSVKVDSGKGMLGALAGTYQYLTDLPFTFSSFYDIQEMGITTDFPSFYTVVGEGENLEVHFNNNETYVKTIELKDNMTELELTVPYITYENVNATLNVKQFPIITNAEKQTKLLDGFENIENNILYNTYQLKYFNALVDLNAFNLFGSNQDVFISTIYLGKDYKKLFISTDIDIASLDTRDKLTGVLNTDFVIKYQGKAEEGSDEGTNFSNLLLSSIDLLSGIAGTALAGPAGGWIAKTGVSEITDVWGNIINEFQQKGGKTNYVTKGFNASPLYYNLEEFIPKIIFERSGKTTTIDLQTNFYGTSCSLFTNNLKDYVKDIINNRTNHKCYIAGNFNVNFLYPQVNEKLKKQFISGVLFMNKMV